MSLSSRSRKIGQAGAGGGQPVYAETPGKTGVAFGVYADGGENGRVDHPAAAKFDPARSRAGAATGAPAYPARHVELGRRLGKREETGPEPGMAPGPEKGARKSSPVPRPDLPY